MSKEQPRKISSEELIAESVRLGVARLKTDNTMQPVMFDISEGWERAKPVTAAALGLHESIAIKGHTAGSLGFVLKNTLYSAAGKPEDVVYLDYRAKKILPAGRNDSSFPRGTKYVMLELT